MFIPQMAPNHHQQYSNGFPVHHPLPGSDVQHPHNNNQAYKMMLPYILPHGSTPSPCPMQCGPFPQIPMSPQARMSLNVGTGLGYRYPISPAPSPHGNDPIGRRSDNKKGGRTNRAIEPAPISPSRTDPAKDAVRRNIQRKLRLKMIRKGTMPPNPTFEELQLSGVQPITPVAYPMPYYYMPPTPAAFDHNGQPIFMQPFPPYPMQRPYYTAPQYANFQPRPVAMHPMSPQSVPRASATANYRPIDNDQLSGASSMMTMSPQSPISNQPIENVFDFKMENIFTEDIIHDVNKNSHQAPEPFLLPDREVQSPNYESFFGGEFIIDSNL